ncbi:hypothetical protein D3C80_1967640 [compost metagenome]
MCHDRDRSVLRIISLSQLYERLKVFVSAVFLRSGLIGDGPHHDAGKVFVTVDQLSNDLLMIVTCF